MSLLTQFYPSSSSSGGVKVGSSPFTDGGGTRITTTGYINGVGGFDSTNWKQYTNSLVVQDNAASIMLPAILPMPSSASCTLSGTGDLSFYNMVYGAQSVGTLQLTGFTAWSGLTSNSWMGTLATGNTAISDGGTTCKTIDSSSFFCYGSGPNNATKSTSVTGSNITSITNSAFVCGSYASLVFNCSLDQATVDDILVQCDEANLTVTSGSISVAGNNAAPSSVGLAAKANLISRGYTVATN